MQGLKRLNGDDEHSAAIIHQHRLLSGDFKVSSTLGNYSGIGIEVFQYRRLETTTFKPEPP